MPQMPDAEPRRLEDEDGVAVGNAAAREADVGRHVADQHVVHFQMMLGRPALRVPAAQHVLDARVGKVGVVRGMRPVHRDDARHLHRPGIAGIVGGDRHALRARDQKRRVPDIADDHLLRRHRPRKPVLHDDVGDRHHLRRILRHRKAAAAGRRRLRERVPGNQGKAGSEHGSDRGKRQRSQRRPPCERPPILRPGPSPATAFAPVHRTVRADRQAGGPAMFRPQRFSVCPNGERNHRRHRTLPYVTSASRLCAWEGYRPAEVSRAAFRLALLRAAPVAAAAPAGPSWSGCRFASAWNRILPFALCTCHCPSRVPPGMAKAPPRGPARRQPLRPPPISRAIYPAPAVISAAAHRGVAADVGAADAPGRRRRLECVRLAAHSPGSRRKSSALLAEDPPLRKPEAI